MTTEIIIRTEKGELACPSEKDARYLNGFIGVLEQYPEVNADIEHALGDVLANYVNQSLRAVGEQPK
jgi:hypothetical protein